MQPLRNLLIFNVLFLRRAHSRDHPLLDSNPLPTDYKTRALTNAPLILFFIHLLLILLPLYNILYNSIIFYDVV